MLLGIAGLSREVVLPCGLRALLLCVWWVVGLGCGLVPWPAPRGARCAYCWGLLGPPGGVLWAAGRQVYCPMARTACRCPARRPGCGMRGHRLLPRECPAVKRGKGLLASAWRSG